MQLMDTFQHTSLLPHIILAKTRIVVVRTSLAADPKRDQCKSFPYGWMKSLLGIFLAIIVPNPR